MITAPFNNTVAPASSWARFVLANGFNGTSSAVYGSCESHSAVLAAVSNRLNRDLARRRDHHLAGHTSGSRSSAPGHPPRLAACRRRPRSSSLPSAQCGACPLHIAVGATLASGTPDPTTQGTATAMVTASGSAASTMFCARSGPRYRTMPVFARAGALAVHEAAPPAVTRPTTPREYWESSNLGRRHCRRRMNHPPPRRPSASLSSISNPKSSNSIRPQAKLAVASRMGRSRRERDRDRGRMYGRAENHRSHGRRMAYPRQVPAGTSPTTHGWQGGHGASPSRPRAEASAAGMPRRASRCRSSRR